MDVQTTNRMSGMAHHAAFAGEKCTSIWPLKGPWTRRGPRHPRKWADG